MINLIKNISDDNIPYKHSDLIHISNINKEQLELFFKTWKDISKTRKLDLLKKFILLSEENVELDYSQIFIGLLIDADDEIKQLSLEGLWEYEDREIIEPVISLLDETHSIEVRISAISLLGIFTIHALDKKIIKRDADKIINELKLIFKNEKNIYIRRKVLEAISPYEDQEINIFINQTYKSNHMELKRSAIFSMGQTYNERWLPEILSELESNNPSMRFEAVNAYAKLCNTNNISPILKLIKDNDHEIRLASLNAIGMIGGENSKKFLKTISKNSDSILAETATEILKNIESEENHSLFSSLDINPN